MNRTTGIALAILSAALLAGCAPGSAPALDHEPGDAAAPPSEAPCIEGVWELDVADYGSQSEAYVLGLGLPIVGFAMSGHGTIQFTADGLVATDIDLTTTGTIVAGDTSVPLDTRSSYTGSGDWSPSADTAIDLANWANVPDPDVAVDPAAPPLPAIDYTDIPSVTAQCSADSLLLQAPGAPLAALWHR